MKKVPVMMQMEALECGAASLAMICAYHGKWLPLEKVRGDCGVSRDGAKAKNILSAARSYGLKTEGYRYEPEQLKEDGRFPCIIHWNFNHFVVLCGFTKKYAILNDPAKGEVKVPMDTFDKSFTGVCIFLEPTEDFVRDGKPASVLGFAKKRLKGTAPLLSFIMTLSLFTFAAGLLSPTFGRVFMDVILPGQNTALLIPFCGLFALSIVILLTIEYIRSVYMRKIEGKLALVANAAFFWHVLRLPMGFFSQRQAGEIAVRGQNNEGIANSLMQKLAPVALNFGIVLFYLFLMLRYNIWLASIGVAATVINVFLSRYVAGKQMNINRVKMRDMGKKQAATVAGISMIETLKSTGAEDGFFEKWAGYQAAVNTADVQTAKTGFYWGSLPSIISQLCNVAVLITGVYFCVMGDMTVGLLFAFQAYMAAFSAPAQSLISAGNTLTDMRAQMERVEDVMTYVPDVPESIEHEDEYYKLSGDIEIKNITFGYSKLDPPLIKDFSLSIKRGQRIAIVGTSGCGKSTMSKLISGLYEPWSGEILYDGKPRNEINRNVLTSSVAVVDQEITLFNDTLSANIKMWDNSIEDYVMIMAVRDSDMHSVVMERDGGYNYKMSEGGRDFSGGQRQRLEIARVLAADPTVIILDEATSALDAKTEFNVVENIKMRGVTCLVIAHRLSTIRDCDEILVMERGVVVERGTHDELMALGGKYTALVVSE